MEWDIGLDCTEKIFPGNRILFFQNIKQQFLCMDVFGINALTATGAGERQNLIKTIGS